MTKNSKYKIATLGSHSALQILKGARDEGFSTICVAEKGRLKPYQSYKVADEFIEIDSFKDYFSIEKKLIKTNAIIIPHGSFVAYLGYKKVEQVKAMYYGNKKILKWESDRKKERQWMEKAGLKLPRIYKNPKDIDQAVIVKYDGASGGKGYFIAKNEKEFNEGIKKYAKGRKQTTQEYIVGVPIYAHYFYSPVTGELEVMGFDSRYESNADSIGRIAARDQLAADIRTSYTVTGNVPIVVRESLLPKIFEMGESVVKVAKQLTGRELFGPFCLEGVIDPNLDFYIFEISARIVAGTNPFINGSPYTWLRYDEPMSTGRRIARDIKMAIEKGELEKVLG
jgi:5-formaminoimidazole-4-carboxamide-1-(beta)-D-ribofuranosyl 5'-monophosphate synthetase